MMLLLALLLLIITNINSFKMLRSIASPTLSSSLRMGFDNDNSIQRGQWSSIGVAGQGFIQRVPEDNSREPCLRIEGPFNSVEFYCCQRATQSLVSSHISNWAEIAECYTLRDKGTHSIVFRSIDGKRVAHMFGWALDGRELLASYHDFKVRADGIDGTPAALKESTHMYRTTFSIPLETTATKFKSADIEQYPLFSIDLYTARMPENINAIQSCLVQAAREINNNMIPDLISMHVLKSIDNLSCILIGTWNSIDGYEALAQNNEYNNAINEVKKFAAFGTLSDVFDKTDPRRLYYISNVCFPNKINFFQ